MIWTSRPLSSADAREIIAWRYPPPFDVYNDWDEAEMTSGEYYAALLDGTLTGFFCFGASARVSEAEPVYSVYPSDIDLGLGLHPEHMGQGLGLSLTEHALRRLGREQSARLAVYAWNAAARKVYERAGFTTQAQCGSFMIMRRPGWTWREATRPLESGMATYPGDPGFRRTPYLFADKCGYDGTALSMTAHTGTHLDGPKHVALPGGVDSWPLDRLCTTVQLIALAPGPDPVAMSELEGLTARRVLIKTRSNGCVERGLSPDAAAWLVARGTELVGVDGLSVGPHGSPGLVVHRTLLGAGVTLLEGLALDAFESGWYEMRCLPLLLPDCDGAQARVLLREL